MVGLFLAMQVAYPLVLVFFYGPSKQLILLSVMFALILMQIFVFAGVKHNKKATSFYIVNYGILMAFCILWYVGVNYLRKGTYEGVLGIIMGVLLVVPTLVAFGFSFPGMIKKVIVYIKLIKSKLCKKRR